MTSAPHLPDFLKRLGLETETLVLAMGTAE